MSAYYIYIENLQRVS